jgi:glucose-6-phosphate isomerase
MRWTSTSAVPAWRDNLPFLAGVIAHWNRNALGCGNHAVLPYTQRLARLPAYLQQLEMESLGKRVTRAGKPVASATGAVIWGEPGSNAQHSFLQLLHQGTAEVSADFLLPLAGGADAEADELVIANCLAQVQALMAGYDAPEPYRDHPGSRPVSVLAFPRLDPATLGALVALYEHKVFVESVMWDINPFDQWGVELGKKICGTLLPLGKSSSPCGIGWPRRLDRPSPLALCLRRGAGRGLECRSILPIESFAYIDFHSEWSNRSPRRDARRRRSALRFRAGGALAGAGRWSAAA